MKFENNKNSDFFFVECLYLLKLVFISDDTEYKFK